MHGPIHNINLNLVNWVVAKLQSPLLACPVLGKEQTAAESQEVDLLQPDTGSSSDMPVELAGYSGRQRREPGASCYQQAAAEFGNSLSYLPERVEHQSAAVGSLSDCGRHIYTFMWPTKVVLLATGFLPLVAPGFQVLLMIGSCPACGCLLLRDALRALSCALPQASCPADHQASS